MVQSLTPVPSQESSRSPMGTVTPAISGGETAAPTPDLSIEGKPDESGRLVIEWPSVLRVGDSGAIRLALDINPPGARIPAPNGDDQPVAGLYATHNLVAEARLEIAGLDVLPQGSISEPLQLGKGAEFYWRVDPYRPGSYHGTLWLYINFIPKPGNEAGRVTLLARAIEIQAKDMLGFSVKTVRLAGLAGMMVSILLVVGCIGRELLQVRRRREKDFTDTEV